MDKQDRKKFVMFLVACMVAFMIVSMVEVIRSSFFSFAPAPDAPVASAVGEGKGTPLSFADLYEKVKPAVVNISTTRTVRSGGVFSPFGDSPLERFFGDEFFERFFGDVPRREFKQQSLGSGFLISSDGYIFTNNHVVEKAEKIIVKLSDGRQFDAKVVGRDAKTDIALIKIKAEKLPAAEIGDSEKVRVGDWVIAIGNPFGLEHTMTAGIVSAKGRVIGAGPYDNFIQTDASINPGNSGGPLFSLDGKVIGINTAIVAQAQGIGFAIPINMAKSILPDLKAKGKVTRAWLGISVQDVTEDMAKVLKLKSREGAIITETFKDDPADRAGLKPGDVVTEINGKKIKDSHELLLTIASLPVGEKITVKVVRDGKEMTFYVTVTERKEEKEIASAREGAKDKFGLVVQNITPQMARELGLKKRQGVIVVAVEEGSPAEEVGIQPQDIILQVNRVPVNSVSDYMREMSKRSVKEGIAFLIKRGNSTFFITIHR